MVSIQCRPRFRRYRYCSIVGLVGSLCRLFLYFLLGHVVGLCWRILDSADLAYDVTFTDWTRSPPGNQPRCTNQNVSRAQSKVTNGNLHALRMKFMTTRQTHHLAYSIFILFEADDTFVLPATILALPLLHACCCLLFLLLSGCRRL